MKTRIWAGIAAAVMIAAPLSGWAGHGPGYGRGPYRSHHVHHGGGDAALWAFGGFVAGAVTAAVLAGPPQPPVVYAPPAPVVYAPPPPVYLTPVPAPVVVAAPPVFVVRPRPPVVVMAPPVRVCPPPVVVCPPPVVVRPAPPCGPGFRVGVSVGW